MAGTARYFGSEDTPKLCLAAPPDDISDYFFRTFFP